MTTSTLYTGAKIPTIGLGTWLSPKDQVGSAVKTAIELGYRHLDFAAVYDNEKEIGDALAEVFAEGKVKREDLFITSKLWNTEHRPERVLPALQKTLADLKLTYLDLYLIHWPLPFVPSSETPHTDENKNPLIDKVPIHKTWEAMEECHAKGLAKHIGVSNFNVAYLQEICLGARVKPAVNQVELHPYLQQCDLIDYCKRNGIHVTAYSPLMQSVPKEGTISLREHPTIVKIADKHKKTPVQIVLRWHIQRSDNISAIPKSVTKEYIAQNLAVYDFALDESDMSEIKSMEKNLRTCCPIKIWNAPIFS